MHGDVLKNKCSRNKIDARGKKRLKDCSFAASSAKKVDDGEDCDLAKKVDDGEDCDLINVWAC